jgi:hypothetical protein
MITAVTATIQKEVASVTVTHGKYDLWLRFVRVEAGGERELSPAFREPLDAMDKADLLRQVAERIVLLVFGSEVSPVSDLPNLRLFFLGRRAVVHMPGAPDPKQPKQVFLKVSVAYRRASLWPQWLTLIGKRKRKSQ